MNAPKSQTQLHLEVRPLPEPEATIWRILTREAWGRENAIRMPELASWVGISTRAVQSAIEYLILEHSKKIGSSCGKNPGYYVITDQNDLDETFNNLVRRGVANFARAYALKKSHQVKEALGQVSALVE